MSFLSEAIGAFNVSSIIKSLIQYLSDALEVIAPDDVSLEVRVQLQKYVGVGYAVAKFLGPGLVASSENDLDDAILKELIDICEKASQVYGLELNAVAIIIV